LRRAFDLNQLKTRGYIILAGAASRPRGGRRREGKIAARRERLGGSGLANAPPRAKFRLGAGVSMKVNLAVVGLVAAGIAVPAFGAPKPSPAAPKPAAAVNLENRRRAPLLNFEIVVPARDKTPEIVVGKLDKPLVAGGKASFPLNGGDGCIFEARWAFEDFKDAGDVDLCNDAHIVLVD
jgi:hypothetical protein